MEWPVFEKAEVIYFAIVTIIALLLLLIIPMLIHRREEMKLQRIKRLKRFSPIKTKAPGFGQTKKARDAAVESVGGRFSIIRKIATGAVAAVWFIAVAFPFLGMVPRTMISVVISAVGVVVGIAARPFIENNIAGIIISFSKLFRIGDTVAIDDYYGTIEDITMTHSVVKLWDWRRYVIPNSKMLAKEVVNYSLHDPYVWAHVEFWVSWKADLGTVERIALELAGELMAETAHEQPRFWVMAMEQQAVKCWITAWTASPDEAWTFRAQLRSRLTVRLQQEGIKPNLTVMEWEPQHAQ